MIERKKIHFSPALSQSANRKGIALILTIAILVILTTIVYSLSSRVSIYKRRQEYIINYQSARYACDSAMKYALTRAIKLKMPLITREDSPDFSDLFALDHEQYKEILTTWAEEQNQAIIDRAEAEGYENPEVNTEPDRENTSGEMQAGTNGDPNEGGSGTLHDLFASLQNDGGFADANELTIPGPYGPEWPLVHEPIKFEIGNAKVEILFKDENAKFPLALALTKDTNLTRQATDALEIFCEWMQMELEEIEILAEQLEYITDYKEFSLKMKPVFFSKKNQTPVPTKSSSQSKRLRRSRVRAPRKPTTKAKRTARPAAGHVSDFAKLLHSSMITTSRMERPLPEMGERQESPMKYLGVWGVSKININTAPRQVLEAIFAFGGDQELIAEAIINQRKIKPYEKLEDLKEMHYGYTDSIDKVKPYLTTTSTFFTVEVRAVCGNAEASSVSLIEKRGTKITKIGMMSI
ncbi:MAG: general secretion pathway protein GspK [Planctomycetes bacterium]|nr:general secretion pathway protein GspK [Planctomycetota bacterium]